ncbi:MAG: RNA polymerase sigma factor [Gemmatimonadetes bacterium]|nr:RNA polymerase sigma factor [Gemmatimonadota bacterium]
MAQGKAAHAAGLPSAPGHHDSASPTARTLFLRAQPPKLIFGAVTEPNGYSTLTDQQLVALARKHDRRAENELFNRHQPDVFSQVFRMLGDYDQADTATQEGFKRAFTRLHLYNPQFRFAPWVVLMAENYCFDHYLTRGEPSVVRLGEAASHEDTGKIMLQTGIQVSDPGANPLQSLVSRELGQSLADLLARLKPEHRTVLTLRYYDNRSYQEIADLMQVAIGTVGSLLTRAVEELSTLTSSIQPNVQPD